MRILIASNNPGKVREIREILMFPGLEVLRPADLGQDFSVEETGATFEENAGAKARAAQARFGILALADDSGLEIDALDGRPGVKSARFLGVEVSYADKGREVLRLMKDVPEGKRTARFRCSAALADADGSVKVFSESCSGSIAFEMRGTGGFGYDPIFVPEGYTQTFAELPAEVKNRISHRAQAIRRVREYLIKK